MGVYHKHHLYGTLTNAHADYLWATPGSAFVALDLPFPSSSPGGGAGEGFRLVPGICMDLNERDFAPTTEYALASFARDERADVLVVAMSWLDSEPPLEGQGGAKEAEGGKDEWEEVRDVISYWVVRSMPLLGSGAALVAANRVGREGGASVPVSRRALILARSPTDGEAANAQHPQTLSSLARRASSSSATGPPSRSLRTSAARPSSSPRWSSRSETRRDLRGLLDWIKCCCSCSTRCGR